MPPRRFKKKSVKRIVEKRVAKAIEEYEKTRTDSNNAGGSGSANTGGTVAPEMHGCSYKTFTNGKPHSFSGTEGVVGLKRWFEKMEQVFEICKCAEDDKSNVKAMMTTEYCPATEIQRMEQELWTLTLKGDDIEAYNNRFHELAKALSIGDRNKRKWEDTREQLSPAAKPKTKADYGLVQAPAKGSRLRWANLPWRQIGARGASSARSLVLSSEENVTRFGHQEGECRELGFLSDCPEVKEPKPRKPSLKGTEARGMVSCAIVSSYGFQRIQLEEVPCRRTISLIPLDGLHINDKLYFIEENIEIRSQKFEAKLYPKLSRWMMKIEFCVKQWSVVEEAIQRRRSGDEYGPTVKKDEKWPIVWSDYGEITAVKISDGINGFLMR
ncbi:hypothetical protein Tco_0939527 [Tanacetum coccineum]|uniref:Retrotransposon gag domain-containing protein n=1 Tax=Tanacetum coccineum TaxID=301880 RepID=A0ABQ5DMQ3_9ASTR